MVDPTGGVGEDPGRSDAAEIGFIVVMVGAALVAIGVMRRRGVFARKAFDDSPRDPAAHSPVVWVAAAIGLILAVSLGSTLASELAGPAEASSMRGAAVTTAGGMAAGIALIGAILLGRRREARRAGLRMGPWDVLTGAAALLLVFPIVWTINLLSRLGAEAIARFTGAAPPEALAHSSLRDLVNGPQDIWWWLMVAGVTIGAPIVEETLYRGFLQSAFAAAFRMRWAAILLTSVFFTVAHLGAADVHVLPGLLALSVALGVIFERTGRLGVAIGAHAAFNALNILLAMAA